MKLEEFYKNVLDMIYIKYNGDYNKIREIKCIPIAMHSLIALDYIREGNIKKAEKHLELAVVWDNIPYNRSMEKIREAANEVRKKIRLLTPKDLDNEYEIIVKTTYWKYFY